MTTHPYFRVFWRLTNLVAILAAAMFLYGIAWEHSTRKYLEGFSDAVVPLSAPPEEKVEAILRWMQSGPPRLEGSADVSLREPRDTLNHRQLLRVCGSATNAFLNLANSGGLETRRLLLLDENRLTKHVVAEVRIGDRWVVVDPVYRLLLRDTSGRTLTKEELRDPAVLREATASIPNYPPEYTFESTVHVRLGRIPLFGFQMRRILNKIAPGWETAANWSLVVERRSFAFTLAAFVLLVGTLTLRFFLAWYADRRLKVTRTRLRDQVVRLVAIFRHPA